MDPDATQNFYSGLSLALLIGGTYNSGTPRYRQGPDKAAAFASSCTQWSHRAAPMQHDHRLPILADLQLRRIPRHLHNVRFRARANCRGVAFLDSTSMSTVLSDASRCAQTVERRGRICTAVTVPSRNKPGIRIQFHPFIT